MTGGPQLSLSPARLCLIVAMGENRVIGVENRLPWRLPEDLKRFKQKTMGKPLIMGRKTFESIGKPLPGRTNIVLTRKAGHRIAGAEVVASWAAAVQVAENSARSAGVDEICVIGGEEIYRLAMPEAARIYLTQVSLSPGGDAFFPAWPEGAFREVEREVHPGDPSYAFVTLDRI